MTHDTMPSRVNVVDLDESHDESDADDSACNECSESTCLAVKLVEIELQETSHDNPSDSDTAVYQNDDNGHQTDKEDGHLSNIDEVHCGSVNIRDCSSDDRNPWICSNMALPLHYILSGGVQNIALGVMYGVLLGTMAVPGHVYVTSRILVAAPWATKVFFGLISDCVPLMGRYRRHYCSIGWTVVALAHFLLVMVFHEPERPFYCIDTGFGDLGNYVPAAGICNLEAATDAWIFTLLLTISTLGLTIAESAADGLTLECAKSWNDQKDRGRIMTTSLLLRMAGGICGSAFLAFCFNGRGHLGWFEKELSLTCINLAIAIAAMSIAIMWQFLSSTDLVEPYSVCPRICAGEYTMLYTGRSGHEQMGKCQRLVAKLRKLSRKMCTYRLAMFVAFNFIVPIMTWMTSPSHGMMMRYWANVQQMQSQLTDILIFIIFSLSILCFQRYILSCRWTLLLVAASAIGCVGSCAIETTVALDFGRSQYLYLISELFLQLPRACNYLVCIIILAELAPKGFEASVYGIISSAHSLAPLIARAISNPLYAYLPVLVSQGALTAGSLSASENYISDTSTFRATVAISVAVSSLAVFASMAFIGLLPTPGTISRRVPLSNGIVPTALRQSTRILFASLSVCGVISTIVAVVFSVLAIMPGSSCDVAVGGNGCE
jgi:hypothetical protein